MHYQERIHFDIYTKLKINFIVLIENIFTIFPFNWNNGDTNKRFIFYRILQH